MLRLNRPRSWHSVSVKRRSGFSSDESRLCSPFFSILLPLGYAQNMATQVTYVSVSAKGKIIVKLNAPTTGWQFRTRTLTLVDDATTIKITLMNKGTSGKVLFDALSLKVNPSGSRLLPLLSTQ